MHGDSKETFGGNVPPERCYVIAAIAWSIQFPGGNDRGASASQYGELARPSSRRRRSISSRTLLVLCLGDRFRTSVSRRRACEIRYARVPKTSHANLQAMARVQRELIHSRSRSNFKFGFDPDVLNRSSRLAAGHMERGFDRERDNGTKEFRRGVGLPKLGQSKSVTESLR